MKTSLNKIRLNSPCKEGWTKLLKYLGKVQADDVELDLLTVLESNGLVDALWCLQAVDGYDREKRLLAVAFAREVQHLMTDPRSIAALDVAERFANGEATQEELNASAYAAANVAYDARAAYADANAAYADANAAYAAYAARAAGADTAWVAADADYAAAADAARAAYTYAAYADAAARVAAAYADAAARVAAADAADAADAAYDAAYDAARVAAADAADAADAAYDAAYDAARVAAAAYDAAYDDMINKQVQILKKFIK
jgi:hypothetical protein